jgi:hypothetical protein
MALKEYTLDTFTASSVEHSMCRVRPERVRCAPNPLRAKSGAPNILFIVQEDTGFGQLGCHGAPIKTPDLASAGVRSRSR